MYLQTINVYCISSALINISKSGPTWSSPETNFQWFLNSNFQRLRHKNKKGEFLLFQHCLTENTKCSYACTLGNIHFLSLSLIQLQGCVCFWDRFLQKYIQKTRQIKQILTDLSCNCTTSLKRNTFWFCYRFKN